MDFLIKIQKSYQMCGTIINMLKKTRKETHIKFKNVMAILTLTLIDWYAAC